MWPPQMPTGAGGREVMLFLPLPGTHHCGMKVLEDLCSELLAFSSDIPSLSLFQHPCIGSLAQSPWLLLLVRKTQRQQDLREMPGSTGFFAGSSTVSVGMLCPRGAGFCPHWVAQALDLTLNSRRTSENTLAFTAPEPGLH